MGSFDADNNDAVQVSSTVAVVALVLVLVVVVVAAALHTTDIGSHS